MAPAESPRLTAEVQLLVRVARLLISSAEGDRIRALVAERLDWEALLTLAAHHRLEPLLHRHVEAVAGGLVPAGARAALWAAARTVASENERRVPELHELIGALGDAGIDAIVMKGPVLAVGLYGELGLRPFGDFDVLVPTAKAALAQRVLRDRGYQPSYEVPRQWDDWARRNSPEMGYRNAEKGVTCDLHWHLRDESYSFVLAQDELRRRLESVEIAGTTHRTLGPEHTLYFLLLHGAQHGWPALGWLVDVAELLRSGSSLDWDVVGAAVRGRRRMMLLGLRLASQVLEAPVPAKILALGEGDPTLAAIVATAKAALLSPTSAAGPPVGIIEKSVGSIYYRCFETTADRLYFAYHCLLKPQAADVMAVPLPRWAWPVYLVIRPVRLLLKHGPGLTAGLLRRMVGRVSAGGLRKANRG